MLASTEPDGGGRSDCVPGSSIYPDQPTLSSTNGHPGFSSSSYFHLSNPTIPAADKRQHIH